MDATPSLLRTPLAVIALGLLLLASWAIPTHAATDTTTCGGMRFDDPLAKGPGASPKDDLGNPLPKTPTEGDDVIFGTNGANSGTSIDGRGGNDVICGFDGNDTIKGGDGNDQIFGNAGNDDLRGEAGADDIDGGDGSDSTDGGLGDDIQRGGGSNDKQVGGAGNDQIFGDDGDDDIDGGDGVDQLFGLGGNDVMKGGAGEDDVEGGDGADTIDGGDGFDATLSGGAGNDTITGGAGEDNLFGGDGTDRLDGGDGIDTIAGENGNDTLLGGSGDDQLFGGEGDDVLNGGDGADQLSGGGGTDRADYADAAGGVTVDLGGGEVSGSAGADTIGTVENLDGSAFDDELTGSEAANVINGNAGEDLINGANGDDTENGGADNDTFDEGDKRNGADVFNGGDGIDLVDYTKRETVAKVTRDGIANDGEDVFGPLPAEHDNVEPDVEGANLHPVTAPSLAPAPDLSAPSLTRVTVNTKRISPNDDNFLDALKVSARFSESTQWTFEILSGNTPIFSQNGAGSTMSGTWEGRTSQAHRAAQGNYTWRITGKDDAGNALAARSGAVTVDLARPHVRQFHLSHRFFNPARQGVTQASFHVNEGARVTARVLHNGRRVRTLPKQTLEQADTVQVNWNGRDSRRRRVAPGRYTLVISVRDLASNVTVRRVTIAVTR
jgi:Ca2+-binding RTX toxin-like protein